VPLFVYFRLRQWTFISTHSFTTFVEAHSNFPHSCRFVAGFPPRMPDRGSNQSLPHSARISELRHTFRGLYIELRPRRVKETCQRITCACWYKANQPGPPKNSGESGNNFEMIETHYKSKGSRLHCKKSLPVTSRLRTWNTIIFVYSVACKTTTKSCLSSCPFLFSMKKNSAIFFTALSKT
jgi:hypothetical protein